MIDINKIAGPTGNTHFGAIIYKLWQLFGLVLLDCHAESSLTSRKPVLLGS